MCGCNRRTVSRRSPVVRSSNTPRPVNNSPANLRALGLQQSASVNEARQMDTQRRRVEKLKRDAIRKSLNK